MVDFTEAMERLPTGYSTGTFSGRRYGLTVKRSADGRRIWLFARELGGRDIVSFNLYVPRSGTVALRPCEMSNDKVVEFVSGVVLDAQVEKAATDDAF